MSKDKSTYSSFPEQEILQEGWRDFLKKGTKGKFKRQAPEPGQVLEPDPAGQVLDPAPASTPDPTPTPKPASKAAGPDYMTISGTEFATMNFLVNGQLLQIIKDAVMVGAAAKDTASRNLQQLFNKEFFPALVTMTKNPNIDIAEGIDMDEFLQEMLVEAYGASDAVREPLTRRQQSAKKGQKRASGGMQRYLRSAGGKPPIIASKIARALTKALIQKANADSLFDAAAEVSSTIKDPKAKAQYEKSYTNQLEKNPQERVDNYKQNVAAFVGSVTDLATKAAAKALAAGTDFGADKAANTAASRRTDEPAPEPEPEPEQARRTGGAALDRMRARRSTRPAGSSSAFHAREGTIKTFKITKEGKVKKVNNEKK